MRLIKSLIKLCSHAHLGKHLHVFDARVGLGVHVAELPALLITECFKPCVASLVARILTDTFFFASDSMFIVVNKVKKQLFVLEKGLGAREKAIDELKI